MDVKELQKRRNGEICNYYEVQYLAGRKSGDIIRELAYKYNCSEQWIYKIIKRG